METKSFKKVLKNNVSNIFVGKFDDFNEKTGIVILTDFSANYSRNLEHQMCVTMYIVSTYLQTYVLHTYILFTKYVCVCIVTA